jgi:hypothetical protein
MSIYEKLAIVQLRLKAPKNQLNKFGNYNYRSCEDILEGVKPLLNEVKAVVVLNDSIELIGDRYYVKAEANFIDIESGEKFTASAYAREDIDKKGMDLAQVTGSVSSYARKYALNGLFCIDDTKDSDATNSHGKGNEPEMPKGNYPPRNSEHSENVANLKCSGCGNSINQAIKTFSEKTYGKSLCMICQKKEVKTA